MERHYIQENILQQGIAEQFLLLSNKHLNCNQIPPVIQVQGEVCAHYTLDDLTYLSIVQDSINAYEPLQFLQKLAYIFSEYGGSTVQNVYENYFILYQLLDEVCDGGIPATTDLNVIKQIIPQQTSWWKQDKTVDSSKKQTSSQSNIIRDVRNEMLEPQFRDENISYVIQQCNLMYYEKVVAQLNQSGNIRRIEGSGKIVLNSQLSGAPIVFLKHQNNKLIQDASLSKNVNINTWTNQKIFEIQPIDGLQTIACYVAQVSILKVPLIVEVTNLIQSSQKFIVKISKTQAAQQAVNDKYFQGAFQIEDIVCAVPLDVYTLQNNQTQNGNTAINFIEGNKYLVWKCTLDKDGKAELNLKFEPLNAGQAPRMPIVTVSYFVSSFLASGLQALPLTFNNEKGKINQKISAQTQFILEVFS